MPISVLVAAASKRNAFLDCIKEVCDSSEGRYEYHFIPDEIAKSPSSDILSYMLDMIKYVANIVIMEVTPDKLFETSTEGEVNFVTNLGVLIEFGATVANSYHFKHLKLFIEQNIPHKELHPYIRTKHVEPYSVKDTTGREELTNTVKKILREFENLLAAESIQTRNLTQEARRLSSL